MNLKRRYWFGVLAVALLGALIPSPAAAATSVTLVASGLDSPRGVAFIDGTVMVAEAGHGSDNPADCITTPFGNTCIGNTSQISWVNTTTGAHAPLVKGFFSITLGHEGALGVSGLSVRGGKLYAQIAGTSREVPARFAIGKEAGHLISVNTEERTWKSIASVGDADFDYTTTFTEPNPPVCGQCPGTQEHDANPNDVLATSHGWLVADSGSNTLTMVDKDRKTTVLYYFPWRDPNFRNFPSDEVPTCVASTGEAVWIGTLAGHLYSFEDGKVTQVMPKDSADQPLLSHVTGCTTGGNGKLYLVNMFGAGTFGSPNFPNGNVVVYNTESGKGSMLADAFHNPALFLPYMAKVGPDGNLWVTSGAICPADGANPFGGGPNPCTIGATKGGRLVKLSLPSSEENG